MNADTVLFAAQVVAVACQFVSVAGIRTHRPFLTILANNVAIIILSSAIAVTR